MIKINLFFTINFEFVLIFGDWLKYDFIECNKGIIDNKGNETNDSWMYISNMKLEINVCKIKSIYPSNIKFAFFSTCSSAFQRF